MKGLLLLAQFAIIFAGQPDIILLLTDDEDGALFESMRGTRWAKLREEGMALNAFVTTPICCPSRSSILTGLYAHNHGTTNNSVSGNCASPYWRKKHEPKTLAPLLQGSGYTTFYAGKYLNQYGKREAHVPPGWDWWFGLVGNSVYFDYHLSENGTKVHYGSRDEDYLTSVIWDKASLFLDSVDSPVFMMICPPAPHAPFTPSSQHRNRFPDVVAPRSGSYNQDGRGKHWLLRQTPSPMAEDVVGTVDEAYRNRKRTLLSIDDLVGNLLDKLKSQRRLDRAYILYSSDNGFHTGQFSLPLDKRQMYDFDIRVPMVVRGPGVRANASAHEQVHAWNALGKTPGGGHGPQCLCDHTNLLSQPFLHTHWPLRP